jgi:hypothetical protein
MSAFKTFVNKNLVAIVMIPSIIGVHYGWSFLQNNEELIPKEDKKEQPIFSIVKRLFSSEAAASQPDSK